MHVRVQVYWPPQKIRTSKKLIYAQLALPLFMPIIKKMICDDFSTDVSKIYTIINIKKSFHFCLNSQ